MTDPWTTVLAIIALLAANGYFVAAEFALVKARSFRIEALAEQGSAAARATLRIQRNIEPYLAACQLGITMASLGLGWVGEPAVEALLRPLLAPLDLPPESHHTIAFLTGFVLFSSLHIVIGEQVPKTVAIRRPEPVSLLIAYPLVVFYWLCYPLNWLLNRSSSAILACFGVEQATHAEVLTSEELQGLIGLSSRHGELPAEKAFMLTNLFRFDERPVERIMVPRGEVTYLDAEWAPEETARVLRETRHSRLPLVEGEWERLLGVVLVKDVLDAVLDGVAEPWRDLRPYAREPLMVPESQRVSRLFETMRAERAHMAFVVDEYGDFSGLVTFEDLLEEIFGDIADELDERTAQFEIVPSGEGWVAHGLAPLTDVERATGLPVDEDLDANTLSGLFMERLERLPRAGDEVVESGYRLRVLEVRRHRAERVLIRPPERSRDDEAGDGAHAAGSEPGRSEPAAAADGGEGHG